MKNIHLLPTDKPSRLHYRLFSTLCLSKEALKWKKSLNIYITSDEKFIRDEYVTDGIEVIKSTPKLVDAQGLVDRRDWKKIVMTNDLELIEDGIQEIGEKFFEWLVLNPYCKEVEIGKTNKLIDNYADEEKDKWEVRYHIYIPERGITITHKQEQKQHLIDIMKGDEELGLYDESREIKLEDVFNDEKREGVKRVIHQHKVLKELTLVSPAHLRMTDNGHGEFPDGYKLTEKGIQYIIEQLNKE